MRDNKISISYGDDKKLELHDLLSYVRRLIKIPFREFFSLPLVSSDGGKKKSFGELATVCRILVKMFLLSR